MKSTSQPTSRWRIRSARKRNGALEDADQQQVLALVVAGDLLAPAARMRCCRSSAWTRISPISSLMGPRSLGARPAARARVVSASTRKRSPGRDARNPGDLAVGDARRAACDARARGTLRSVNRSCSDLRAAEPERAHPVARPPRRGPRASARARRGERPVGDRGRAELARRARRRRTRRGRARRARAAPASTGAAARSIAHAPVLGRRAQAAGEVERGGPAVARQREDRVGVRAEPAPAAARRRRAAAARAARARGGSAGERRASSRRVDRGVEHRRPRRAAARACAGRSPPPPDAARAARAAASRGCGRARTPRCVASSRQASPRSRQYAAVSSRVTPSSGRTSRPERAGIPSSARRPGRGGEPVEHGLDLVGRGVAGGDRRRAASRSRRARSAPSRAHACTLPRRRAGAARRASGTPSRAHSARAVRLVGVRLRRAGRS